jgi:hypothetical protein
VTGQIIEASAEALKEKAKQEKGFPSSEKANQYEEFDPGSG